MDMQAPDMKPKKFFEKPEGVAGAIGLAGISLLFFHYGPQLVAMAQNTVVFGIYLAVIAAGVYAALDKRVRSLVWYGYKSVCRALTGIFITIDPIGIIHNYIEHLENNMKFMDEQMSNLRGQMEQLNNVISKNEAEKTTNLKYASQAKKTGNMEQAALQARAAGRLAESNVKLTALYTRMKALDRILAKMYKSADFVLQDTSSQVELMEREYKAIKAGYSAFKSAMSVVGENDKKEIFEMTMEALADNIGQQVGEMERYIEKSKDFIGKIDIQNGMYEEEGLKALEEWEKSSPLLSGKKTAFVIPSIEGEEDVEVSVGRGKKYEDLLKK